MAMNWKEIAAVCDELGELSGAALVRAHQPLAAELIFELRLAGENHLLLISAADDLARIHLVDNRPKNPKVPFGFVGLLRARLQPARLVAIDAVAGERQINLRFETLDEADRIVPYTLVAELSGRHANLFLLDANNTILGSLRKNRSKRRSLHAGQPYTSMRPNPPDDDVALRFELSGDGARFEKNAAARALFEREAREVRRQARLKRTRQGLTTQLKKTRRALVAVERDLARAEQAPLWRKWADLLQINFPTLKKGDAEIVLDDVIAGGGPQRIELDPARSPQQNAERYYTKARRAERGQDAALARLDELEVRRDHLLRLRELLDEDETAVDKVRTALGLVDDNRETTRRQQDAVKHAPYRRFVSGNGLEIRVGKSAKDNDALTFRHARGDDFWLHASGWAGSHVVVPLARNQQLDSETLIDAATLAAHYSKAGGGPIEVIYTRVKQVRKQKKAPPGQVLLSAHKSLMVDIDPKRLRRLMDSSR